jgi:hypothetical protein
MAILRLRPHHGGWAAHFDVGLGVLLDCCLKLRP